MIVCEHCGREFKNKKALGAHLRMLGNQNESRIKQRVRMIGNQYAKGYHHTEETKIKVGKKLSMIMKQNNPMKNPDTAKKLGRIKRQRWQELTDDERAKRLSEMIGLEAGRHITKQKNPLKGQRISQAHLAYYQTPRGIARRIQLSKSAKLRLPNLYSLASKRPNIIEKQLLEILNGKFPSQWKYSGNGQIVIGGCVPDFVNINGKKQVIELFGDYWHSFNPFDEAQKVNHYKEYGYNCLVIWENELCNRQKLYSKLKEFINQS